MRKNIQTNNAPAAIGNYSQAIQVGNTFYFSGQIALDPMTSQLVSNNIQAQAIKIFENLKAVAEACSGTLNNIVKLNIFLTDINNLSEVNEVMSNYFEKPFPARTSIQVSALPKGASLEIDAVMVLDAQLP